MQQQLKVKQHFHQEKSIEHTKSRKVTNLSQMKWRIWIDNASNLSFFFFSLETQRQSLYFGSCAVLCLRWRSCLNYRLGLPWGQARNPSSTTFLAEVAPEDEEALPQILNLCPTNSLLFIFSFHSLSAA